LVAYTAEISGKRFVVVNGKEGKQYDDIITAGRKIPFDSPESFHYLALNGNSIYLVQQRVK
jgi:hypothetical protein